MKVDLPLPNESEVRVVPVTYADNHIPAKFSEVKLFIQGPDLIIEIAGHKKLILPLAAKFATVDDDAFKLVFSDDKVLAADDILYNSTILPSQHNVAKPSTVEPVEPTIEVVQKIVTKDVIKEVYLDGTVGGAQEDAVEGSESIDISVAEIVVPQISQPERKPVPVTSSGLPPEPDVVEQKPILPIPPDDLESAQITLYQTSGVAEFSNQGVNKWLGGTGNSEAKTDPDLAVQFAATNIDLSSQTSDWNIYVNNPEAVPNGYVGRVINFDESSSKILIASNTLPEGVTVISADSPLGRLYGLTANQILIVYPEGVEQSFEVAFQYYNDVKGQTVLESAKFVVTNNPTTMIDGDGRLQLSTTMNDTDVTAGSGNDTIYAGHQNGSYDGGAGNNTVNYSQVKQGMTIDLSSGQSVSKVGTTQHTLTNIQNVVGSDYGDTIIGKNGENNIITGGVGDDIITGGTGNNKIDGGDGYNTISYEQSGKKVEVDLSQGIAKHSSTSTNYQDTVNNIQHVIGSAFDDTLIGHSTQGNHLEGGAGNDTLVGLGGNNILDGGSGFNTVSYEKAVDKKGINIDLTQSENQVSNNGFGGQDSLINVQKIIGSKYGDTYKTGNGTIYIEGNAGNNTFIVGGDDASRTFINGGTGSNVFYSGKGVNQFTGNTTKLNKVDYSYATSNIEANLVDGQVYKNGFGGSDILSKINSIVGSNYDDRFIVGGQDYTIQAGAGNDLIIVQGSGNRKIDGGAQGSCTIDYSAVQNSLNIDMTKNEASDNGFGGKDSLINITKIIGSQHNDVFISGNSDLEIVTGDGNNIVYGSAKGNDIFNGGNGENTLNYSKLTQNGITINFFDNTVTIQGTGNQDNFSGFDHFIGSNLNDTFILNKGNYDIDGGNGFDAVDYSNIIGGAQIVVDLSSPIGTANGIDSNNVDFGVHSLTSIEKIIFPDSKVNDGLGSFGTTKLDGHTHFVGSSNANDTFYILGGGNTIDGNGGSHNTADYSDSRVDVGIEVTIADNGNIKVDYINQNGTQYEADTLHNINTIVGSNQADIFNISSAQNLSDYSFNGGRGHCTLNKSGLGDTFDFTGTNFDLSRIDKFDFSDGHIDNITINIDYLFDQMGLNDGSYAGGALFNLETDSNDIVNITASANWVLSSSGTDQIWHNTATNQEFVWSVSA